MLIFEILAQLNEIKFDKLAQEHCTVGTDYNATLWALTRIYNSHTCEVEIQGKIMPFWPLCCKSEAILSRSFVLVTGIACSYGKILSLVAEIFVFPMETLETDPAHPLI